MYRHVVLLTAAAALLAWPELPASADPGPADPDGVTPVAAAVAATGPAVEAPRLPTVGSRQVRPRRPHWKASR